MKKTNKRLVNKDIYLNTEESISRILKTHFYSGRLLNTDYEHSYQVEEIENFDN